MFFKIICNDDEKLSITKNNIKYNIIFNTSDKNPSHVKDLINLKNFDDENLIFFLKQKNIYFFLIIWSTDRLFVAVDQVASKNTLYLKKNGLLKVLTSKPNNCEFDNSVKDEIYYSGYSIDNYSIFKDYKCLRPGEYLSIKNKELKIKKWNLFYPIFLKEKIKNNEEIFHDILLKEFNDIKKNSLNKKIMVPLSAGLDSRLIVCFLKYHNFEVETFTYGYQNKKDFKIADQISKSLKIKNYKIVMDKQHSSIYKSDYFKEYLSFRDIGIRANNFGDFGPLFYLKKKINL